VLEIAPFLINKYTIMQHLQKFNESSRIIYKGQIDISKWSEKDDIAFFEEHLKYAKQSELKEEQTYNAYVRRFDNDGFDDDDDENPKYGGVNCGYTYINMHYGTDKVKENYSYKYVLNGEVVLEFRKDDRATNYRLNRLDGPAKIIKGKNGKYRFLFYLDGHLISRDLVFGKKPIDNIKVLKQEFVTAVFNNIAKSCKQGSPRLMLSKFKINVNFADMKYENFLKEMEMIHQNVFDSFDITISGFDGINIGLVLKEDVSVQKLQRLNTLTTKTGILDD
jgi:hypothetical protein